MNLKPLTLSLLVATMATGAAAQKQMSPGEEMAVLNTIELDLAETHCGYKTDLHRLEKGLMHLGWTMKDVYTRPRSHQLQADIDEIAKLYQTDKAKACDMTWKGLGPDGPMPFLQRQPPGR